MAWSSIRFARSATKHGALHEQSRHVIENARLYYTVPSAVDARWDVERLLFVGDDSRGVALEVVAIELDDGALLVVHAMRLRRSYRALYRRAMREMGA